MNKKLTVRSIPEELALQEGKRFLQELEAKGPNLDRVGKTFYKPSKMPLGGMPSSKALIAQNISSQAPATDFSISPSRELRKLRIDIMKEFSANRGRNTTGQKK
jgi:hypothetical protein